MEDYTEFIPEDFPYNEGEAIALIKNYQIGLDSGIRFFSVPEMREIKDIFDLMTEIKDKMCLCVWGENFGTSAIGLHAFLKDRTKPDARMYPMPQKIKEILNEDIE